MSTNYIATVHKPTAVTDATCGLFFHKSHPNLIVAKGNILEFWSVLTDPKTQSVRLELDKDFQIFGEIAAIKLIKPLSRKSFSKPLLFFITEKHHVAFVEPSYDQVATECLPITERLDSDDEGPEYVPESGSELPPAGNIPASTRRRRLSPNSRDKIDITLQRHYDMSRSMDFNRPSLFRSISCQALFQHAQTDDDWPVGDRPPTIYRSKLSEFSHLRGPFWRRVMSDRRGRLTAETEPDRSRFEPVTATTTLRRRLYRLPAALLQRLFRLRPLLRAQLENLPVDEGSTESDVDMSPEQQQAETRSAEASLGENTDEDMTATVGTVNTPETREDDLVFHVQRHVVHAAISRGEPRGTAPAVAVQRAPDEPPNGSSDSSSFSSNDNAQPPDPPEGCPLGGLPPIFDDFQHEVPLPASHPPAPMPQLVEQGPEEPLDTRLTNLLQRLMEAKYRSQVEELLGEIAAVLSSVMDEPSTNIHELIREIQRLTRTLSAHRIPNYERFHGIRPDSSMASLASSAEAAECVAGNQHLRTRASGRVRDRSGRPCENGVVCAISSDHAVIALSLIVGAIKFIAVKATLNNSEGNVEHFNARVEPCRVLDMQFLNVSADQRRRALCILFQDVQGESKLCIYDLSLREKFLRRAPRSSDTVEVNPMRRRRPPRALASELNALASLVYDGTTNHVMPTTTGGAMFVGEKNVTFYPRLITDNGGQQATAGQEASSDDLYYLRSELAFQHFRYISSWASLCSVENDIKFVMCEQGGHLLLAWLSCPPKKPGESPFAPDRPPLESGKYSLRVDYIGRVTNASVMVTLPYNHLFLGSKHGDSQLVRLDAISKSRAGTHRCPFRAVHVISTFYNLAPIVDMCLVPTTRHKHGDNLIYQQSEIAGSTQGSLMQPTHQRTLVTCSNVGRQGTLRFLRNGLGLQKLFFCKAPQVCAAFSLGSFRSNVFLLSYPSSSALVRLTWPEPQTGVPPASHSEEVVQPPRRLFAIESFDEGENGFDLNHRTYAVHHNSHLLCQVTSKEVRLFSADRGIGKFVDYWAPASGDDISQAAVNLSKRAIIVGCGGSTIFKLLIETLFHTPYVPKLTTADNKEFPNDFLSCLSISAESESEAVVVCGFSLTGSIHVLSLNTLKTLHVFPSACDLHGIPRSLALARMGTTLYMFVGDSTGCLSYCEFTALQNKRKRPSWKKIRLSCEPIFMRSMEMSRLLEPCESWEGAAQSVLFIGGIHPLVMCAPKQGKLTLVNVNAQNVVAVDGWSDATGDYLLTLCENFEQSPRLGSDRLGYVDRMELSVCRLNGLNQVQVKTLSLHETPRRIVYHPSSDCLAVLVYHSIPDLKGGDAPISLESDFRCCASYQAPKSTQLFDQQAGQPFAAESPGDVMRPATKRKSKDDDDPLAEESRKGSRHGPAPPNDESTNDSAHPVRWDTAADNKLLERWVDREEHAVLLIDRGDLRFRTSFFLKPDEQGCSIAVCTFKHDCSCPTVLSAHQEYLVVGTGMVKSGEIEPTSGRILIFEIDTKNYSAPLLLLSESDVDGAVYSISEIEGLLVATINCRVKLFGFSRARCYANGRIPGSALTLFETHSTNSLALYVKCNQKRCLVGDLLRSLELFELQKKTETADPETPGSEEYKLVSIARDHNPNWVTAIEIINPDVFVATENFCNLFVCTSQAHHIPSEGVITEASETDRDAYQDSIREVSLLHLGEFVNVIRCGSLVSQISPSSDDTSHVFPVRVHMSEALAGRGLFDRNGNVNAAWHVGGSFMLGSTGGWIGQMMCISQRLYIFLWEIQKRLQTCLKSIGRIDHGEWRAFESEMKVEASSGFIDGSLMESLVDMDPARVLQMLQGVRIENTSVAQVEHLQPLFRLLEELSRLH